MDLMRLVFPEWQGAFGPVTAKCLPVLEYNDATQGYFLGSKLLQYLAPPTKAPTFEVNVALNNNELEVENGIYARKPVLRQLKEAVKILDGNKPNKVVTIGGDCSVSVGPFSYLADKYKGDLAVVYYDAHPDISIPGDKMCGYSSMALAHILGLGDKEFLKSLPAKVPVSNALLVGLRRISAPILQRKKDIGLKSLSTEAFREENSILKWLKTTGVSNVAIHIDLDVIDPNDLFAAVVPEPDGLTSAELVESIAKIGQNYNVVGLTVAEHMPTVEIRMRRMLNNLPLFQ